MAASEVIRLEIPNSPKYVSVARKALEAIAASLALTDRQTDDLKLALGEACTNAVKFSSPDAPVVRVEFGVSSDSIEIKVRNHGNPFDTMKHMGSTPNVSLLPTGGLGIYVIEQCMDSLDIACTDGETVFTMTKNLRE